MKKYDENPRKINKKQKKLLKESIEKYGDLSCVVHNLTDDQIISGNQRSETVDVNNCKIELTKEYKKPTKVGTVALGFIIMKGGERLMYRQVKWDKETARKANVAANKIGGIFDNELLALHYTVDELGELGFEEEELKFFDNGDAGLNFGIKSGSKDPTQQMTFTMRDEQVQEIKAALRKAKERKDFKDIDFFGNNNKNGNAIYLIVKEWVELKK